MSGLLPDGARIYEYVGQDPDGMHRLRAVDDVNHEVRIDALPSPEPHLPGDRFGMDEDSIYSLA